MKLEDITAEIRPRTSWEAVDLGCALARRNFFKVFAALTVTAFPLCLVIIALLHQHPVWTLVAIWWLKPLFDRVSLHYLSKSLFGAPPTIKSTIKQWPRMIGRFLIGDWSTIIIAATIALGVSGIVPEESAVAIVSIAIIIFIITSLATRRGRFLPWRSFLLPLSELEHLKGKQYAARSKILFRRGSEESTWLALTCLLMEFAVALGILFLALAFIPEGQNTDTERILMGLVTFSGEDVPAFVYWTLIGLYLVAVTVVGIFYTGGGFGLYLNSRTLLEGWDVELSFRKLAARLNDYRPTQNAAALIIAATTLALTLSCSTPAAAQESPPSATETIDSVLAHKDFIVHKRTIKERVDDSVDLPQLNVLDGLLQLLFWAAVIVALAALVHLIYKNRHIFTVAGRAHAKEDNVPKARTLMGMNVAPETLPPDIAQAARDAWNAGRCQEALSFLYRGAICWLIEKENLPVHESDTEGDCVRLALRMTNPSHSHYFNELTNHWIRLVYAKLPLDDDSAHRLCDQWPFDLRTPNQNS
ncbi:MAG: DUF4129 domain-containing protein [Verrucomicrobiota bacterium]